MQQKMLSDQPLAALSGGGRNTFAKPFLCCRSGLDGILYLYFKQAMSGAATLLPQA
jgi:hypothetical protein